MSNEFDNELDCDPDMTLDLLDLFQTPVEERNEEWVQDFLSVVPTASLRCIEPQIQRGPDGFPYLILCLPESGEEFDAYSLKHALSFCLQKGCGIAIFSDPKKNPQPEWVFSFGSLWAFERFGNFIGDPGDELPEASLGEILPEAASEASLKTSPETSPNTLVEASSADAGQPRQVTVGRPSDDFIPSYARTAISRFLKDTLGLQQARVALVVDPIMKPSRALMFVDLQPERFEKQEQFVQLMQMLRWFLPATRGLMAGVPQLAEHAVPL